jgi:SAM-dependent methyltransferase
MKSTFDYGAEVEGLKKTYSRIVKKSLLPRKPLGHILEIGGGNGFFLEAALELGFDSIEGVEPSQSAVDSALPRIKKFMRVSMFNDTSVKDDSADVIAIFHTLDHLERPVELLKVAFKKLKSEGRIVIAVHNVNALSARLLKSRSPIFDIEHTYLYSRNTLTNCLKQAGFVDIKVGSYSNFYSLAYLTQLLPLPRAVKEKILNSILGQILSKIKIWIPLGNLYASGKRE